MDPVVFRRRLCDLDYLFGLRPGLGDVPETGGDSECSRFHRRFDLGVHGFELSPGGCSHLVAHDVSADSTESDERGDVDRCANGLYLLEVLFECGPVEFEPRVEERGGVSSELFFEGVVEGGCP